MNVKLLIRRYSYFSTIVLSIVLVALFYLLIGVYQNGFTTFFENLRLATLGVGIVILAASVSFLPRDILQAKKDKRLCIRLGLNFNEFLLMSEGKKDEIRSQKEHLK